MDVLKGNISWIVPNADIPAHWIHAEYICKLKLKIYKLMRNWQWATDKRACTHNKTNSGGFLCEDKKKNVLSCTFQLKNISGASRFSLKFLIFFIREIALNQNNAFKL